MRKKVLGAGGGAKGKAMKWCDVMKTLREQSIVKVDPVELLRS